MNQVVKIATFVLCTLCFAAIAAAATEEPGSGPGELALDPDTTAIPKGWAVGLAGFYKTGIYEGRDAKFIPVPLLYFRNDKFLIYVKKADWTFFERKHVAFALTADLRLDGHEAEDSDFLEGMDNRHFSLDGGAAVEFDTPVGDFGIKILTDLLGQHEGQEYEVSYEVPIVLKRWYIKPILAHRWKSKDLANYYYGVEADEATIDRPEYEVGSTTSWALALAMNCRISKNFLGIFTAEYQAYSSDIKRSPIVDDSGQFMAFLGAGWHF